MTEAVAAARRWAREWERAWREHDPARAAHLYAEAATFRSHPFREPHAGADGVRAYAEWAFASEVGPPDVRFGEPAAAGDDRAAVEYWAAVRTEDGPTTIAGVALLRFDGDGLVVEQRDYWNEAPGASGPHADWGR